MEKIKTSTLSNGLLWFGASVSIAEILTGTMLAPLGFAKGLAAIIIGHIIGCALFCLAGLIGARSGKSGMESVANSFGKKGSSLFAVLNILQLVGWTAVMIIGGARSMGVILNPITGLSGELVWCIVIGVFILIWVLAGLRNIGKLNLIAVSGLFILTLVLGFVVFSSGSKIDLTGSISFGMAIELSVAMPLSWLPLISDYTKDAKSPKKAALVSTVTYFLGSSFMYAIGLGAVLLTGETDIAKIMVAAGLGMAGVFIVLISTVTTTYLDVYSAGVSFGALSKRVSEKSVAVIVCILGTLIAMFTPIEQYQNFLYLISSVFAPMITIVITDFFILKKDYSSQGLNKTNLLIWVAGFILYRMFINVDTIIGSTVPVMILISLLCLAVNYIKGRKTIED